MTEKKQRKDSKMYVRISSTLEEQLDQLADFMGTTKSALITYYVAQGVKQEQSKFALTKEMKKPEYIVTVMKGLGFTDEKIEKLLKEARAKG